MATLTRRLQILIDDHRFTLLEREAERRHASVAEIVRDAIDALFDDEQRERAAAVDRLLASEPFPVDDWEIMKREIEDAAVEGLPG